MNKDFVEAVVLALNAGLITKIQAVNLFSQKAKLEGFEKDKDKENEKKVS